MTPRCDPPHAKFFPRRRLLVSTSSRLFLTSAWCCCWCCCWAAMLVDTFTTPTISIRSIPSSASASASASSSRLYADISFVGDSKATLQFEAPASKVREWLYTPECSDLKLLGATQGTQDPKDLNMWDCQQPAIDFLGLNLQPYFVSRLERQARDYDNDNDNDDGTVTVSVVDSRIEILNKNNPAARSVASIMGRAKFTGTRITILVKRVVDNDDDDDDDNNNESQCKLSVDLTLRLHVPLPPFVPLPPGFNSLGGKVVSRTGRSRTAQLLRDLKAGYQKWAAEEEKQ